MPLLGPEEKGELEELTLELLTAYYDKHGPTALMQPGVGVVVRTDGPAVVESVNTVGAAALASVETRTLFTALCYLAIDGHQQTLPVEALKTLATEATSSVAAQINRLAPD